MNIFAELVHAVIRPKSYGEFLRDKKGKTFLFGFVLVFFYFLITIMVPLVKFQVSTGGIMHMVDEYVPDFTIGNRKVTVERTVEYDEGGTYVFVDTDRSFIGQIESSDLKALLRVYDRVVIMDSEQAVLKNNTQTRQIAYEDLDGDLFMTKDTMMESVGSMVNILIIAGVAVIFVGMELLFFFGVLFVALFGMVVASCMHYNLTFGQLYKLGIYARTTPLLLKAVFALLPLGVPPMYFVISTGISLWYLAAAIRHMKTPALTAGPLAFSSSVRGPVRQDPDPWNYGGNGGEGWNNQPGGSGQEGQKERESSFPEDGNGRWGRDI